MKTAVMAKNSIMKDLKDAGQSPWLDFISRDLIRSGDLQKMVQKQGILGVTSNPSIFEKAINQPKGAYDREITKMVKAGKSTFEIYDQLTIQDIQEACDVIYKVYEESRGEHGFVSLEVTPNLAYYEEDTVSEAIRLFKAVNRPNVMIKVPATPEGVEAIRRLIGEGVNINVTLIFSQNQYKAVANAYIEGLEAYAKKGGQLSDIHSVASVFVSRYDSYIDKQLAMLVKDTSNPAKKREIKALVSQGALANSKLIYQEFSKLFDSERFKKLQLKGAWVQKLLWGSTGTKNPDLPDTYYVQSLIGEETVNTMPMATLNAMLDHGEVIEDSVLEGVSEARKVASDLKKLGFDLNAIGDFLQKQGAELFCDSFDVLMASIEQQKLGITMKSNKAKVSMKVDSKTIREESILDALTGLQRRKAHELFFEKNPNLWKSEGKHHAVINNRLGWLHVADWTLGKLFEVELLRDQLKSEKIDNIILLGMGGSSLAPEVMDLVGKSLRSRKPTFTILDTTHPDSILRIQKSMNLKKTVFIVASKSGTTAETLSQYRYFYEEVSKLYKKDKKNGAKKTGQHFIAITDNESWLQQESKNQLFRRTFVNPSDIGGRFSALSYFGMVPAVLMGLPFDKFLYLAKKLYQETLNTDCLERNDSFLLGAIMGSLSLDGVDKMHVLMSKTLEPFGAWMEQLIAESTGKEGKGIVPIVGEKVSASLSLDKDRYYVIQSLKGEKNKALTGFVAKAKKAGVPVIQLEWNSVGSIAAEFLRWEIVTSIASAVMDINPFDEPNVTESKEITTTLLKGLKRSGKVKAPSKVLNIKGKIGATSKELKEIERFLGGVTEDGYVAILAYVDRTSENQAFLKSIQSKLSKKLGRPVLFGFGPRFLHSIGQLYKGGKRNGSFIEIVDTEKKDLKVPHTHYSFSQLIKAQAFGDLKALSNKKLATLVLNLGKNQKKGFEALRNIF